MSYRMHMGFHPILDFTKLNLYWLHDKVKKRKIVFYSPKINLVTCPTKNHLLKVKKDKEAVD